jgi:hypothetical protein
VKTDFCDATHHRYAPYLVSVSQLFSPHRDLPLDLGDFLNKNEGLNVLYTREQRNATVRMGIHTTTGRMAQWR